MAKPSTTPSVWNSDASNRTTPSGGQFTTGFVLNSTIVSSYFNYLLFHITTWLVFLNSVFTTAGGITVPADADVTVSGTGQFKHGDRYLCIGLNDGARDSTGNAIPGGTDNTYTTGGAAPWSITTAIQIPAGKRITSITMYYNNASASSIAGKLKAISTTGVATDVTNGGITSPASTGNLNTSTTSLDKQTINTEALYWYVSASHTTSKVYWIKITYHEE